MCICIKRVRLSWFSSSPANNEVHVPFVDNIGSTADVFDCARCGQGASHAVGFVLTFVVFERTQH